MNLGEKSARVLRSGGSGNKGLARIRGHFDGGEDGFGIPLDQGGGLNKRGV